MPKRGPSQNNALSIVAMIRAGNSGLVARRLTCSGVPLRDVSERVQSQHCLQGLALHETGNPKIRWLCPPNNAKQ
eukprot:796180-Amphidinium_carterae.1